MPRRKDWKKAAVKRGNVNASREVVGVLGSVTFGQDNANNNQGGNYYYYADYNGESGQVKADYAAASVGSSDTDDASESTPSESNSDSQDSSSASNDEDTEYSFNGDLALSAYRDGSAEVPYKISVAGQAFLSRKDFKKLDKLQKRTELNAVGASVKGFAVATGKKDACTGILEAMTDLYFIMPTFRMKYQGIMIFSSSDLEAIGGEDGMIKIKGDAGLRFSSSETSRKKRSVGVGGFLYLTK